jgi:hypothetical protein
MPKKGRFKNKDEYKKAGSPRINPKKLKPYNTEYAAFAQNLAASGAAEIDIAYIFGISTYNLRKWKSEHPEFSKCINRGKQLTKAYLIGKGIKAAAGYDWIEKKKQYIEIDGKTDGAAKVTETNKHQPVDGKLLMFLVAALERQLGGKDWIAKQYIESTENKNVTVKVIDGNKIAEQFDKLAGKWSNSLDTDLTRPKLVTSTVSDSNFVDTENESSGFEEEDEQ